MLTTDVSGWIDEMEQQHIPTGGAFVVYPNPVQPGVSFVVGYNLDNPTDVTVTVSDMLGKTVYRQTYTDSQTAGNIEVGTLGWAKGMYMVTIQTMTESKVIPVVIRD